MGDKVVLPSWRSLKRHQLSTWSLYLMCYMKQLPLLVCRTRDSTPWGTREQQWRKRRAAVDWHAGRGQRVGTFKASESCSAVSDSLWSHGLYSPWNSAGQNTGVGSLSLLQGIFPTQGSNPGLLHCRQIPYQFSHKESPRILEWIAFPFSSRSSQPKNQTGVSCIAGGFFTSWAIWKEEGGKRRKHIQSLKNSSKMS